MKIMLQLVRMKNAQILFWNVPSTGSDINIQSKIWSTGIREFCIANDMELPRGKRWKIELFLDNLVFLDGKKISIRNLFLFMLISPVKNRWGVNEEIWDFSRFVDFSCTSLTGMCILIKIRKKVMETLTWDRLIITVWKAYSLWITFIFTLNHSFLVS